MLHTALAGLALFASLTASGADMTPVLGKGAAAPTESAVAVINGKVLQNTTGDALVGGTYVHIDRLLIQPTGSTVMVFEVVFAWIGPASDGADWTELYPGDVVRMRGALGLSTTGAPLIAGISVEKR